MRRTSQLTRTKAVINIMSSPSLVLESPRGLFSVHVGILRKQFQAPAEEKLSNRIDKLVSESEDKQAESKASFFHVLLCGLPPADVAVFRVVLPLELVWVYGGFQPRKIFHRCTSCLVGFQLIQIQSNRQPRRYHTIANGIFT